MLRNTLSAAGLAILLTAPAWGQVYHPLDIGFHWEYSSATLGTEAMAITEEREILGVVTRVRREEQQGQTFENFWTMDQAGNLYLHGAVNLTEPYQVAYVPPIKMVSAPLSQGKTWITTGVATYDLEGNPTGGTFDYPVTVFTEGMIQVPAGEFYAYGVGFDAGYIETSTGSFDLLGLRVGDPKEASSIGPPRWVRTGQEDNSTEWYAVDVGLVQVGYTGPEDRFQLTSFGFPEVPVQETTWGSIKAYFYP